jgi:hypothetical protein
MSKKTEIDNLKIEFPTLNRFDAGVEIQLTGKDYDEHIEEIWQARQNAKIEKAELEARAQAKIAAEGKLAALGLTTDDLRALGL